MVKLAYFEAIRQAKNAYWKSILVGIDHQSIRKAWRLTAGSTPLRFPSFLEVAGPKDTCDTLLGHFFLAYYKPLVNTVHRVLNVGPQ